MTRPGSTSRREVSIPCNSGNRAHHEEHGEGRALGGSQRAEDELDPLGRPGSCSQQHSIPGLRRGPRRRLSRSTSWGACGPWRPFGVATLLDVEGAYEQVAGFVLIAQALPQELPRWFQDGERSRSGVWSGCQWVRAWRQARSFNGSTPRRRRLRRHGQGQRDRRPKLTAPFSAACRLGGPAGCRLRRRGLVG